jgi:hypothetical protein
LNKLSVSQRLFANQNVHTSLFSISSFFDISIQC